jgi:RNA recognition motif-containing protein
VGGISHETTKEGLKEYFAQFGEVTESVIIRDGAQHSRGFGFITFANSDSVENTLSKREHTLDKKLIDPKRAFARSAAQRSEECSTKVFIGGVPSGANEETTKKTLEKFGVKIQKVELKYDKSNNKMRGFGFVDLSSEEDVDKLCSEKYVEMEGKNVEVKRAEPRRYGRQGPSKLQSPGHGRGGVGLYGEMQNHYYPQYPHNYGYATNFQSNYPMYNSPSYSHPPQGVGYPNSYGFGIQGQNYGYGSSGYESSGSEQRSDSYGMQRGYQQYAGQQQMGNSYNQDIAYSQGNHGGYSGNGEGYGQNSYNYSTSDVNPTTVYSGGYHGGDKQSSGTFGGSRGGQQSRGPPSQYGASGGFGANH